MVASAQPYIMITIEVRKCIIEHKYNAASTNGRSAEPSHVIDTKANCQIARDSLDLGPLDCGPLKDQWPRSCSRRGASPSVCVPIPHAQSRTRPALAAAGSSRERIIL
jgi:hypothetical protein